MRQVTLLLSAAVLVLAAEAVAAGPTYPIYEIVTGDLPDLHDGSLADWELVLPGMSLSQDDFASVPSDCGDCAAVDVTDLAYRVYLGWNAPSQTLWIGAERVDDIYINTYSGGAYGTGYEPESMRQNDVVEFMVDGDHSGGTYSGFTPEDFASHGWEWSDEMAKLVTGHQAQRYTLIPESPDGSHVSVETAASGWCATPFWADAGGAAWGTAPTTSIVEASVAAWDALDWRNPAWSSRSALHTGRVVGFQVSLPDYDEAGVLHSFHTIAGLANTWRTADSFVDGELIGCDWGGCEGSHVIDGAVQADSWARVKASLR